MKSKTGALLLSFFFGVLGIDRFYLGYVGIGLLKLVTGGCLGILYLVDLFRIASGSLQPANGVSYKEDVEMISRFQDKTKVVDVLSELEQAADLHKQGALSDGEFEQLKAEYLAKM